MEDSRAEVEAARDRVVADWRGELEPSLLQRFLEGLSDFLGTPEGAAAPLVVRWILTILVVALLVFLLVRIVRRFGPRLAGAGAEVGAPDVRHRVTELRDEARAAAERGDLGLALRLYVFALLLGLGERGDLRFRPAWTNRELLRRGDPGPEALRVLQPIVDELEPKEFGREPTTPADIRRLEELCAGVLEGGR